MIPENFNAFGSLIPYWVFGLATAASFYAAMLWIGAHLRPEFKTDLTRWLNGTYEGTWATQFGRLFDTLFGERHFSAKRVIRSAIASVIAVFALYVLFAHVLGVLGSRTFETFPFWQVLVIGAAVNIIPDYISLIETRWLLGRFGRVQSVLGQIALLMVDLVFTGAIILAAIVAYSWLFMDGRIPSPIEVLALFSVFAIFFYSTFLTSVWAWLYVLSLWFVRLFTKLGLRRILDIEADPVKQIALVGSALVVAGGVLTGPVFRPEEGGFASAFDDFLCRWDIEACFHAARATGDDTLTAHFMELACRNETNDGNCGDRLLAYFDGQGRTISDIWEKACESGYPRGCRALGHILENGKGVEPDLQRALALYRHACDDGDMGGCNNLGTMYHHGKIVEADVAEARAHYARSCDGGYMLGCSNLGAVYEAGQGVPQDYERAVELFRQACDGNDMQGCSNLGYMYDGGRGVNFDPDRAASLFRKSCDGQSALGCFNLGLKIEAGAGVDRDQDRSQELFKRACAGGFERACSKLPAMTAPSAADDGSGGSSGGGGGSGGGGWN